jgi:SAM-dependent methyltransferase
MTWRLSRIMIPHLVWNQEIYGHLLLDSVSLQTRWLDAGCGHRVLPIGLETLEDAIVAKTRLAVGTDLDFNSLRRHRSFRLIACSTLDHLPFGSESFELISCNMVVEHLRNPAATFQELERVLAPGGSLVIHTPNTFSYVVAISRIARALLPHRAYLALVRLSEQRAAGDVFPVFYRANTRDDLKHILEAAGLSETAFRTLASPRPICNFFVPIGFLELMVMRATMTRSLCPLASTILATYQKPVRTMRAASNPRVFFTKNGKENVSGSPPRLMQDILCCDHT